VAQVVQVMAQEVRNVLVAQVIQENLKVLQYLKVHQDQAVIQEDLKVLQGLKVHQYQAVIQAVLKDQQLQVFLDDRELHPVRDLKVHLVDQDLDI